MFKNMGPIGISIFPFVIRIWEIPTVQQACRHSISIRTFAFGTLISSQRRRVWVEKHPNYSLPFGGKVSGRLNEKLRKAHEIAAETAEATQNNYASYYNLRSGKSNSSKSGTSWLDLRSRLRFQAFIMLQQIWLYHLWGDVTDHISSDCQELDDVQRLELLNTLGKFSSLFSSLPGLAKVKGHNLKLKPVSPQKDAPLPHTYCFAARSRSSDQ
ncbi:hypothetical protein TNCV_635461 [Trichonephila clavipes]|nr:hypothetical protein TNCV_635461 [Trichonephila clavipes]